MFFEANFYHIICLSETWLKSVVHSDMVSLPNYVLLRCDREGRGGGGVGMYVHESLGARVIEDSGGVYVGKPEYMFTEIRDPGQRKLLVATVYRPPHVGYLGEFQDACLRLLANYNDLVVFGDFNINLCEVTHDSVSLKNFIAESNFYLVPYMPTHHVRGSSTLIDLCFVGDGGRLSGYGQQQMAFLSAHDLISVSYRFEVRCVHQRVLRARDYSRFESEAFLSDLQGLDWSGFFSSDCVDRMLEFVNSAVVNAFDRHAPMRQILMRRTAAPWLTPAIKDLMRARDRARRGWRRYGGSDRYAVFVELRNWVQRQMRGAKSAYYVATFGRVKASKDVWAHMRHLGLIRSRSGGGGVEGGLEELADHFATAQGGGIPVVGVQGQVVSTEFDDTRFYFANVDYADLRRALRLSGVASKGVDGISLAMLKRTLPCLEPVFLHLFNFSLMHGVFPELWRAAIVHPVPKVVAPAGPADYRPVSLLCAVSKVLEKVVAKQIGDYLGKRGLHDPCQSAYRVGHSTQTALLKVTNDIREAADGRMVTFLVLFDFSRAFDSVGHDRLLEKLKELGFSTGVLAWLRSYLEGRRLAVRDSKGALSTWREIGIGVPQGSVLGPLLFALYLLDFRLLPLKCKYHFYADDLQIYVHSMLGDVEDCVSSLNKDIDLISEWAVLNSLKLNATKTKTMVMGTSRQVGLLDLDTIPRVRVNGAELSYVRSVRDLSVRMSYSLSWDEHVRGVVGRINSTVYQLKLHRELFPTALRIRLVTALVLPHLDYCCLVYLDCAAGLDRLLQALNSAVRFIFDVRRYEHITPYFRRLGWLKVVPRRRYLLGCFVHSILSGRGPDYIRRELTLRSDTLARDIRGGPGLLSLPLCRTEFRRGSFVFAAAEIWNSLPPSLQDFRNTSGAVFRTKLYEYMIACEYADGER